MSRSGPIAKIKEVHDIPLDKIVIGNAQVRTRDVDKRVDELAESIRAVGLLNPILVVERDDGKYEVLTGQRRFLAHQKLNADTILAAILDRRVSEVEAKIISLTENLVRVDPGRTDYIEACTYLYKMYGGNISAVAKELGIPRDRVSNYIQYDRLISPLKEIVDTNLSKLKTALRAQEAATTPEGVVNEEEALTFFKEMDDLPEYRQDRMLTVAQKNPDATLAERLEEGRKQAKVTRLTVVLGEDVNTSLGSFAEDEGTTSSDAAVSLIEEGLDQKGYLKR